MINIIETGTGPGPFCIEHILLLLITAILYALGIYFLFVRLKEEKKREKALFILCLLHLVLILTNRISVTYAQVELMKLDGYTWLNLIPNTFCGLFSLILPFFVIFGKKNNPVLYYLSFMGLIGGIASTIYPTYLSDQTFFDIRSITGLLHHITMVFILIYCILIRKIDYSVRKWYIYPIGQACLILIGLFEIHVLGFSEAMNLTEPLVTSNAVMRVITTWYMLSLGVFLAQFPIAFIYEHFRNQKTYSSLFREFIGKTGE